MEKYSLPKTTIWHHVHKINIPDGLKNRILSMQGGSTKRKLKRIHDATERASTILQSKERELVVAVAMLYWAEGHKNSFVFTNTDVEMLKLYVYFLNNILGVSRNDYRALIRMSDPIIPSRALNYWSKELNLPISASVSYTHLTLPTSDLV